MFSAKVTKIANIGLRLLIVVVTLWYLIDQLFAGKKLTILNDFLLSWQNSGQGQLLSIIAVALMPLNLFLETLKWRLLVSKLERVKINKAFTAVLSGISVSMFMPNRVGDYLGRVFILEKGSHIKGVLVTMIGSMAQLLVTLIAGGIALLFFLPEAHFINDQFSGWLFTAVVSLVFVLLLAGVLLYFNINLLYVITKKLFPVKSPKLLPYVEVFNYYGRRQLAYVLGFSALRYLVFSLQFVLFLWAFGVQISYSEALMLVALSYLLITLIPTIALSELGVRGSVSIYLFSAWFAAQQIAFESLSSSVFLASTAVWVVNIALPALLGVFFVYRLKFFRR